MPQFDRQLTVGVWKVITNFQLRKACGIYRTTNHVYKMVFVSETKIYESNVQSYDMFLSLPDFGNVLNGS